MTSAQSSDLDSFRVWTIFVLAFGSRLDHCSLAYKRIFFQDPSMWTTDWINQIISPSSSWVTFLTLNDIFCSRTDLVQLSRLTNLGVLTIGRLHGEHLGLEDNVVRAWGRAASEAGAFPRLRILVCRSQHFITGQIFTFFRDFPVLGLLLVDKYNCSFNFKEQAKRSCWHRKKDLAPRISFLEAEVSASCTWRYVYSNCFKDGVFDDRNLGHGCGGAHELSTVLDLVSGPADNKRFLDVLTSGEMQLFARRNRTVDPEANKKRLLDESLKCGRLSPRKRALRTSQQQRMRNWMNSSMN